MCVGFQMIVMLRSTDVFHFNGATTAGPDWSGPGGWTRSRRSGEET